MKSMFKIENGTIYGSSYATMLDTIEFITWRMNADTGEYWMKFHLPSNKEIRIKVNADDLRTIVNEWSQSELKLELGETNELDY